MISPEMEARCVHQARESSHPVLSKLLSANASGYLASSQTQAPRLPREAPLLTTYSLLIELTTALVKGEQEGLAKAIVEQRRTEVRRRFMK